LNFEKQRQSCENKRTKILETGVTTGLEPVTFGCVPMLYQLSFVTVLQSKWLQKTNVFCFFEITHLGKNLFSLNTSLFFTFFFSFILLTLSPFFFLGN
jgi:hypothetical protein